MCAGFHGLRQSPKCLLKPAGSAANSAVFILPSQIAPAARSRYITVDE
jgi:hypothetical protein